MAKKKAVASHGANLGFEAELWQMADALRGSMDAAEYKHVVLGVPLKYTFRCLRGRLNPGQSTVQHERLGRRAAARGQAVEVRLATIRKYPPFLQESSTWKTAN